MSGMAIPVEEYEAEAMGLSHYPGYIGMFTRNTYPGAIANGTRIIKANSEPGDVTKDGTAGTVMGSLGAPEIGIMYFVEWDSSPSAVIGVVEKKVAVP